MRLLLVFFVLFLPSVATAAVPQAFDPVAATNAYLATVSGAARARSDAYFEGGYWLILWDTVVGILSVWLPLHFGVVRRLSAWAGRVTGGRPALRALLFLPPFLALVGIMTLPWSIYTEWVREHQYAMSNQAFGAWFGEWAINFVIDTVLTSLLFLALFSLWRRLPRSWWAWGTLVAGGFLFVAILIAPVFIDPLFNKYTPMAASPLRDQIVQMAHANGVPTENVLVVDASRQTKRISANVSGIGPTVRVALNDNLLNRTSPAEVRAVMGHELGHYVLGHVASLLVAFTLLTGIIFLLLDGLTMALTKRFGGRWGIRERDDPAIVAPALIVASVLGMLATPLFNNIVRFHESQADYFGVNAARAPDGFAKVALRLSEYRKLEPSPLEEIIFYDHPSGRTRILMAMRWKAQHVGEPGVE